MGAAKTSSDEYDIVICGGEHRALTTTTRANRAGGGAGCPIAARLAESLPKLKILLIERGADNRDAPRLDRM